MGDIARLNIVFGRRDAGGHRPRHDSVGAKRVGRCRACRGRSMSTGVGPLDLSSFLRHYPFLEFLAVSPLLWLALTLGAYIAATSLYERANKMPLVNPTLLAITAVVLVLSVTGTSYK